MAKCMFCNSTEFQLQTDIEYEGVNFDELNYMSPKEIYNELMTAPSTPIVYQCNQVKCCQCGETLYEETV